MDGGMKVVHIKDINDLFSLIDKKVPMFIKFYADWCGHCKNLVPVWQKLIEEGKKIHKEKNIAIVDVNNDIMEKDNAFVAKLQKKVKSLEVKGFPTIGTITYNNGVVFEEYKNDRTLDAMLKKVNEIAKQSGGKQSGGKRSRAKQSGDKRSRAKQSGGKRSSAKRSSAKHTKRSSAKRSRTKRKQTRRRY
jgi:thiol-disulfide isomerase/thioredoxin